MCWLCEFWIEFETTRWIYRGREKIISEFGMQRQKKTWNIQLKPEKAECEISMERSNSCTQQQPCGTAERSKRRKTHMVSTKSWSTVFLLTKFWTIIELCAFENTNQSDTSDSSKKENTNKQNSKCHLMTTELQAACVPSLIFFLRSIKITVG